MSRLSRPGAPRSLSPLLAALALLPVAGPTPALASEDAPSDISTVEEAATGAVKGTIRSADGAAVAGAEVLLVPLGSGEALLGTRTDRGGDFELPEVPHGYYDLTVLVGDAAYMSNRVLLVPPEKEIDVEFDLDEIVPSDRRIGIDDGRPAPGTTRPVSGVARLRERLGPTGWSWFKTGRGAAVLIGSGTALIGGIIALADDDDEPLSVSPILP